VDKNIAEEDVTWSDERVLPVFQAPQHLDIYHINSAPRVVQFTVATLVGLINRPQPRVYLTSRRDDAFWLDAALSSIPRDVSPLAGEDILHKLLSDYRSLVQGLIIYDPALSDSINVATMLAGQRDAIIVAPEQAQALQGEPYNLALLADLRVYKWTHRLQAYRWAQDNLLSAATPRLVAGLDPAITVGIRPFLVAARAFIYWLDPLDFLPDFKAGLLSERCLMRRILNAYAPGTGHFGWFVQEGAGVILTSHAALPVFASDYFSNLEVWASVPQVVASRPAPQQAARVVEAGKSYISFTLSEGDNLQYMQERFLRLWRDPARGTLPIGWPIAPILLQAAPTMLEYYTRTATPNDEFIAGPSGIGYMYPSSWPREQLAAFLEASGRLMQQLNLTSLEVLESNFGQNLALFFRALLKGSGMALIDRTLQQRYAQELRPYGVRGILSGGGQDRACYSVFSGVPVYQNLGIATSVNEAVSMIKEGAAGYAGRPILLNIYVLAWKMTPSDLKQVAEQLGSDYEVVTPGTLLAMLISPVQ